MSNTELCSAYISLLLYVVLLTGIQSCISGSLLGKDQLDGCQLQDDSLNISTETRAMSHHAVLEIRIRIRRSGIRIRVFLQGFRSAKDPQ